MIIVTHDLGVARLLSHRIAGDEEWRRDREGGLTDRVLDDPREPYTQLLVSSILPACGTMTALLRLNGRFAEDLHHAVCRAVIKPAGGERCRPSAVRPGQCAVLVGPSGAGNVMSVLKLIYGSYRCDEGAYLATRP